MVMQEHVQNQNAKVYAVSFSLPEDVTNKILGDLESRCGGIEFVGRETIGYPGKDAMDYAMQRSPEVYVEDSKSNSVLEDIQNRKEGLDGLVLLFGGFCDNRYLLTGLPTLMIDYNAFPNLQIGFKDGVALGRRLGTKFITATYSTTDASESVSASRLDDLVEKVELFNAITKMKNTKIMDVQVRGFGSEPHEHWWRRDQEVYLQRLKETLGIDVVIVDYRDLFKEYGRIEEDEAKEIAAKWIAEQTPTKSIKNTRNVGGVTEEEVTKAGRLYLAADRLMKEYGCNAITMDATTWSACESFAHSIGEQYLVSGSLPLMEFRLHGIPACCQSDMEGLVTQILGECLTGRPGLHGDLTIDPFNDVTQVCHCNAPINPYGDDYRAPYSIGGEPRRRPQQYVDLPQEGPVTIIKTNVLQEKISVWTGELVPGESIYKNFFESCCCTKLIARANAKSIYENYDYRTFGNHNSCFYGEFREKVKSIASLIGFEVVEEDR